ncbi:hypothetical protein [Thermococcus sibiricus]|nr:hypothetical protein [Thermococcus sibiricus]
MKRYFICLLLVVSLFFMTLPPALAEYYVVLDSSLSSLSELAEGVTKIHNGTAIMVNISYSNLTFLGSDDTVLFVVNSSEFNSELVYSLYRKLDYDGDGIYDPVIGFLPVDSYIRFKEWTNAVIQTHRNKNPRALFVCPHCSSKIRLNGSMYYLHGRYATYENYLKYSKDASLIWIAGHGDPSGVDLGYWRFDEDHMGDVREKVFVFESCSVGMIWLTTNPIALSLLGNGSLAIVASVDSGGVSYFPPEYWISNYTIGKLAQINNAYFMKIGISPKVVVLGDPAFKFGQAGNYFKQIPYGELDHLDKIVLPKINGYAYVPRDSILIMLWEYVGPLNLWRGFVTERGIFTLLVAVSIVLIGPNISRLKKRELILSLVSSIGAIAVLYPTIDDISPQVMFKIYIAWTLIVLATYRKHTLFGFLLAPVLFFVGLAAIMGLITMRYSLFVLTVGTISTFVLWLILKLNYLLLERFEQHLRYRNERHE